jgi:hypothetical protein
MKQPNQDEPQIFNRVVFDEPPQKHEEIYLECGEATVSGEIAPFSRRRPKAVPFSEPKVADNEPKSSQPLTGGPKVAEWEKEFDETIGQELGTQEWVYFTDQGKET